MDDDELREVAEEHIAYELSMLVMTARLLKAKEAGPEPVGFEVIVTNALIESYSIHARVVRDFLANKRHRGQSDDVIARDYVDDWDAVETVDDQTLEDFNGQVFHLTRRRLTKRPVAPEQETRVLLGAFRQFLSRLSPERRAWFADAERATTDEVAAIQFAEAGLSNVATTQSHTSVLAVGGTMSTSAGIINIVGPPTSNRPGFTLKRLLDGAATDE